MIADFTVVTVDPGRNNRVTMKLDLYICIRSTSALAWFNRAIWEASSFQNII